MFKETAGGDLLKQNTKFANVAFFYTSIEENLFFVHWNWYDFDIN